MFPETVGLKSPDESPKCVFRFGVSTYDDEKFLAG